MQGEIKKSSGQGGSGEQGEAHGDGDEVGYGDEVGASGRRASLLRFSLIIKKIFLKSSIPNLKLNAKINLRKASFQDKVYV